MAQPPREPAKKKDAPTIGPWIFLGALAALVGSWAWRVRRDDEEQLRLDLLRVPPVLHLDGAAGKNRHRVNGIYHLINETQQGRPVWVKRAPGSDDSVSYLLYDECKAWLVSQHPTGDGERCDGWAFAPTCRVPWKCAGEWKTFAGSAGWKLANTLTATPIWDASVLPGECSAEQEQALVQEFGGIDIVIPWVNGSDPGWLSRRNKVCVEWCWQWTWDDAIDRSPRVARCIDEAIKEGCPAGAEGWGPGCTGPDPFERESPCFENFATRQCDGRARTITDHDELRYLLRSIEAHLRWHTGRIVLIVPRGMRPRWLRRDGNLGRLHVMEQEDLFEAVMKSEHYVPHKVRGGPGGYAPDHIYNDFPVSVAFPFIPGVSRYVLLLDDDIVFARTASPCDLFVPGAETGLRLFGDPSLEEDFEDIYDSVFQGLVQYSADLWVASTAASRRGRRPTGPYYDPFHAPRVLDMAIFREIWAQFPRELSVTLDTPVRYPNVTDIVGLHHSEVAERARVARSRAAAAFLEDKTVTGGRDHYTWVEDLHEFPDGVVPTHLRWFFEVYLRVGTLEEYRELMAPLKGVANESLPKIVSFQDHLSSDHGQEPKAACLREHWLLKLLPARSSFEDPSQRPERCRNAGPVVMFTLPDD